MRTRIALVAVASAILAGCRTAPPPTQPVMGPGADAPWAEQRAGLDRLDSYSLKGRVAVAANGQGFSGSLRYQQHARRSDLSIDGPMGIGGLRATVDGSEISIATGKGENLDGNAARAELERRLGFELPLVQLRWWLLGIPAPGAPAEIHDDGAGGPIRDFLQDGWRVSIDSRAPGLGFSLPQRLTAEREGARLKLLVDGWQ